MLAQYRPSPWDMRILMWVNEKKVKIESLHVSILVGQSGGFCGVGIYWKPSLQAVPEKSDIN